MRGEGPPVTRSKAWCSMTGAAFYRFDPELSQVVGIDCKEDNIILEMLWEVECFIFQNAGLIRDMANLLSPIE